MTMCVCVYVCVCVAMPSVYVSILSFMSVCVHVCVLSVDPDSPCWSESGACGNKVEEFDRHPKFNDRLLRLLICLLKVSTNI